MTALELIAQLRDRGIRIAARDGELELDAPRGALDAELRAELIRRKPELLRLLSWSRRSVSDLPLVRVDRSKPVPLSWAQQRLWFLDQLEPDSSAYNISWTVRLRGELDQPALQYALDQLVARHESLRTTFPAVNGEARQRIVPELSIPLQHENLNGASDEALRVRLGKLAAAGFDLAEGPLVRAVLLQLDVREHILLVVIHHIVADGASMRILFRELAHCYEAKRNGSSPGLPELPVQYADYAVWQRNWLDGEQLQAQTDYWVGQLKGLPPLLELPWDRPRAAAMRYRGASVLRVLPAGLAEELRALGRARGATLFMVMLSAFYVLLQRYSGRADLVVGTPMGGRPRTDLEGLIGFFINTVVLRADLEGNPDFTTLLRQVREVALAAHANQELPFEKLVEVLQPRRELSYSPIFQVMFDLQEEPRWKLPVRDLEVIPEVVFSSRTASFDLTLSIRQAEHGLDAMFEYDTDLFDEQTIERLAGHYQTLLEEIVAAPDQTIDGYALADAESRRQLVATWSAVTADYPEAETLHSLFAARAARDPRAPAAADGGRVCTYADINAAARALASRLGAAQIGPGDVVAVYAGRRVETVVAILAALRSGACVLPLDPDYPAGRLAHMLKDSGARIVLVDPAAGAPAVSSDILQWVVATLDPGSAENIVDAADACAAPVDPDSPAMLMYTSGTTGRPKGVALAHRGLVNYVHQLILRTELGSADRVLQFASPGFDIFIEETFAGLLSGATLVMREEGMNLSAQDYLQACARLEITWASLPTAWWHSMCSTLADGSSTLPASLRQVVIGGEQARPEMLAIWRRHAPHIPVLNTYGPTEASIAATWCDLGRLDGAAAPELPIGHPVPNCFAWVLDARQRPVPVGVPGELYIGGVGVGAGYWRQPELSAERFLPDPFNPAGAAQLYRTGDRARYRADGQLVFLGRVDQQVKLRGHRIEPAEIEAVLAQVDGVMSCVVVVHSGNTSAADGETDARLVAYFTGTAEAAALLDEAGGRLPAYMLPSAFVRLDSLPLTPNGKLDRNALPEPRWSRDESAPYVPPRTPLERQLCDLWAVVLGLPRVGVTDNFFALGGHSLLATRLVARIREALNADLPLREVFDSPTVGGLAAALEKADGRVLDQALVPHAERHQPAPLSAAQQRLWMLHQLDPASPAYNLPWAGCYSGDIDERALQEAVNGLVARHESLRTRFGSHAGDPVQLVAPQMDVAVQVDIVRGAGSADDPTVLARLAQLAAMPFDLTTGPLFRVFLLRPDGNEREGALLILMHHIVADGWSVGVLFSELAELYKAAPGAVPARLPTLPVQYADYALWQRDWLAGAEVTAQERYWAQQLADVPPLLELPLDRPRPSRQSMRGAWVSATLETAVLNDLKELAQAEQVTLFMVLLAAFKAALASQCGTEDVVVGTPIAGRRQAELEGLIGCFLNTLPLRTRLDGNPGFRELVGRVRRTTLDAFEHQDLPFESLLEIVNPARNTAYAPLVQVMFNLNNTDGGSLVLGSVPVRSIELPGSTAKFDLNVALAERPGGLRIGFEYNTDLFAEPTVRAILEQFLVVLRRAIRAPDARLGELVRMPGVPMPQPAQVFQPIPQDASRHALTRRFAQIVAAFPERPAVSDARFTWTYRELDGRANAVAARVAAACGGEVARVGVWLEHDARMPAALLGVQKAGCAYVPLDRRAPAARLARVMAEAGLAVVLADMRDKGAAEIIAGVAADLGIRLVELTDDTLPDEPPGLPAVAADSLAYILFTSGSTGTPKGVMQSQGNVVAHARVYGQSLHVGESDRLTLLAHYGFDAAVMDIYTALLSGACLQVVDVLGATDPADTLAAICASRATVLHATPTVFRYLLEAREPCHDLGHVRAVVLGGEEAQPADLRLFKECFGPGALFVNGLGPSESTTALQFVAGHDTELHHRHVPVGLPVAETEVVLLDSLGRESPICGEIVIRSRHLSIGYRNQPELTAARFSPAEPGVLPEAGDAGEHEPVRQYRSGDQARILPDGMLVFTGRRDDQLKIRGQLVEPAEVEAALGAIAGVQRCAVAAWRAQAVDGGRADARLVAYVSTGLAIADLRRQLAALLPAYMQPAAFVRLGQFPLLSNGKLDRNALPEPDWQTLPSGGHAEPTTEAECSVATIWAGLLAPARSVGLNDDFFALGGHSLLATRMLARVRDALGVELTLADVFAAPVLGEFMARVDSAIAAGTRYPELLPQSAGELPPLSWAQQRLWFLDQIEPDSAAYNLHWAGWVEGAIDAAAMQTAVDAVVARHASLRTRFSSVAGEPVQIVVPKLEVPLREEWLPQLSEERLQPRILELIQQPFDLQEGPLLRVHVFRGSLQDTAGAVAAPRALILLVTHHIISDGWSMGILIRELAAAYNQAARGQPVQLGELPVQYPDYAVWQRAWLSGGELERQEAYWRTRLQGAPPLLELPLDKARPPVQRFRGAWVSEDFPVGLRDRLHELAGQQQATLFMVLLAAFKVLLLRHTGREDILVGAPIAGRRRTELEGLIGFFLNTLVMRTDLGGNPAFTELLDRVRETTLGAYDHQELPFEKLLEILRPARSMAYTPVVQVMFNLHNEPGGSMVLDGARVHPFSVDRGTAKFDLSVAVVEHSEGLQVGFEYNTDLFDRATVAELLCHYGAVLESIVTDPRSAIADLRVAEPGPPERFAAEAKTAFTGTTLSAQFAAMVQQHGDRPAVRLGDRTWTYRRLDACANAVAAELAGRVERGAHVGLLLGHDPLMLAGLLGVLKAGCAYVPLDSAAPPARLQALAASAELAAVVGVPELLTVLEGKLGSDVAVVTVTDNAVPTVPLDRAPRPDDMAYMLFTSGSTGQPKGVLQTHANVLEHMRAYTNALGLGPDDRLTLFSTYGFDASVMDIFGALLNGACLYPLDLRSFDHPGALLDAMSIAEVDASAADRAADTRVGVTVLHATPTVFRFLMRHKVCRHNLQQVRAVVLGGEEARSSDFALFKRHFAPPAVFVNGLGPSESTLALQYFADHQARLPGQTVPVGWPVAGTEVVLLDEAGQPAGVTGEIAICSAHVSPGYWREPALTAERFLAAPTAAAPGRTIYRTGDRARRLPDGSLVYLGRLDAQVKIRGHRIELGEIEAQLAALSAVERCTVLARSDGIQGDTRLVAYIVSADGAAADAAALRAELKALLPEYMVPAAFVFMEELPLLPNGKVDRGALPQPAPARDESAAFVRPRTPTEQALVSLWCEVLGLKEVGIHDDFFELGGHSLLAAQLAARITDSLQVGLPLRRLFDTPTVAGLAEHVDTLRWALDAR